MTRTELLSLAHRILSIPTAPYHEHGVRAAVEEYCRGLGLQPVRDRAGNVIVKHPGKGAPLVFVAHMDHPGFEVVGQNRVEFLGSAAREMFVGSRVRIGDGAVRIKRIIREKPHARLLEVTGPLAGEFGMWDVSGPTVRAGKLHAPGIDDVLSVVVALATAAQVRRGPVWFVFTRAEEVGFHGAIKVAEAGLIPRDALVVSLEMSRERPWARQGQGPVVRIGDRMSTFDSHAALFFMATAKAAGLPVQRALMDGGSCEATAFAAFGYRVGGLCLPLGNYHNIGPGLKPRAEYVSVADLEALVKLTVAAAARWREFGRTGPDLKRRVVALGRAAPRKLKG